MYLGAPGRSFIRSESPNAKFITSTSSMGARPSTPEVMVKMSQRMTSSSAQRKLTFHNTLNAAGLYCSGWFTCDRMAAFNCRYLLWCGRAPYFPAMIRSAW